MLKLPQKFCVQIKNICPCKNERLGQSSSTVEFHIINKFLKEKYPTTFAIEFIMHIYMFINNN